MIKIQSAPENQLNFCTTIRAFALLFCLLPAFIDINSQELKRIIQKKDDNPVCEEYYVLKEDRSVKQGKYVRYLERLAVEKYVQEFGTYSENKKNGVWFTFNISHPLNPMNIVGEYSDGKKNGQWFYFYTPPLNDTSVLSLLGFKKLTRIIEPKRKDQELQIFIDTTGIKLAATGNFEDNKKTGKWSYYSQNGQLIKEYDFSENKITYSAQNDSISISLSGGITHFLEQLNQMLIENIGKISEFQLSKVSFEVITSSNSLYVNNLTAIINDPFAEFIENQINEMPRDWIDYDPLLENFSVFFDLNLSPSEKNPSVDPESIKTKLRKK